MDVLIMRVSASLPSHSFVGSSSTPSLMWAAATAATLALLAPAATARGNFPNQIPNTTECARCHPNPNGGGTRHVFGDAVAGNLAGNAINWPAVCLLDSDDDGETNGAELGDPCCVWTAGATPFSMTTSDPSDENATSGNVCPPVEDAGPGPIDAGPGPGDAGPIEDGGLAPEPEPTPEPGPPPSAWACAAAEYNDGAVCNCGCEAGDPDCDSPTQATCDVDACRPGFIVDTTDTRYCIPGGDPVDGGAPGDVPAEWGCDDSWYGSGDGCDCGCGVVDADCSSANIDACSTNSCPNAADGFIPDSADPAQCILAEDDDGGTCSHTGTGEGGATTAAAFLAVGALLMRRRRRTAPARSTL